MTLLHQWDEISVALQNRRLELVLKSIEDGSRLPGINDEDLQSTVFAEVVLL